MRARMRKTSYGARAFALAFCIPLTGIACTSVPEATPDAGAPEAALGACDLHNDCGEGDGRPSRRSEIASAWDPVGQRLVVFGGTDAIPVNCGTPTPNFLDETWSCFTRCGTGNRSAGGAPERRGRHSMTYDARAHRMLIFGGRFREGSVGSYLVFDDLWQFDLSTDAWTKIPTSSGPSARVNATFQADATGDRAYLFGGNTSRSGASFTPKNDLWALDLQSTQWTLLNPEGTAPLPRLWHAGLFDPARKRLVIFGGADETAFFNDAQYFSDVWSYEVEANRWEQLHDGSGTAPEGRFWSEWAYDEENDTYLLFGGHDDGVLGNRNDLWAFSPTTNEWETLRGGDVFNQPANGFCDFPPDFTTVDAESPERRNAHALVYASQSACPGLITALGKTDCGAADDAFRWNATEQRWEELVSAREGEMCLRADGLFDCQDMCF